MSKYEFQNNLKEAVLLKMEKQSAVLLLDGAEIEACCPSLGGMEIPEEGLACLVTRNSNRKEYGYGVAAVSLGLFGKEGKSWICLKPMLFEEAVGFFLESGQMGEMTGDCGAVRINAGMREAGADFETGDAWIKINVPSAMQRAADGDRTEIKSLFLPMHRKAKHKNLPAMQQDAKRMVFLTIFQHVRDEKMQWFLCRKMSENFGMVIDEGTEFWAADMRLAADGITLVSYQNITNTGLLS